MASGYEAKVRISKEVYPKIIGKGGAQIRKLRDETDTKIDFPRENSDSDVIVITGKRENVEKAKSTIEAIEKETVCGDAFVDHSCQYDISCRRLCVQAKVGLQLVLSDFLKGILIQGGHVSGKLVTVGRMAALR